MGIILSIKIHMVTHMHIHTHNVMYSIFVHIAKVTTLSDPDGIPSIADRFNNSIWWLANN